MDKRKIVKSITMVLITCACTLALWGCGNKASGLFDDIKWGASQEETKKLLSEKEGAEPVENPDGTKLMLEEENYRGVEGVKARIECSFQEEKLNEVFIYLEFDENAYTNEEIMAQYADLLTEEYGKCSKDTPEAKIWKLKESEVHLANFSYGTLVVDYMQK